MLANRSLDFLVEREEERRGKSANEMPEGLKKAIEATKLEIARAGTTLDAKRIKVSVKPGGKRIGS